MRVALRDDVDAIAKPLEDGKAALVVFNKGDAPLESLSVDIVKLFAGVRSLNQGRGAATDVYGGTASSLRNGTLAIKNIAPGGVVAYIIELPQSSARR
jgi:vacuolar-type H+-ATPase subunit E/Vma4